MNIINFHIPMIVLDDDDKQTPPPLDDEQDETVPPPLDPGEDETWDVPLDEKQIYGESDSDVDQFREDIHERYNDDDDE